MTQAFNLSQFANKLNSSGQTDNTGLQNSTISGVALGSNLNTLTIGTGLSGTSYNGSSAVTIANSGVTSIVAGTGISVSGATGAVTVSTSGGTGVTSLNGNTGALKGMDLISTANISGNVSTYNITGIPTGYYMLILYFTTKVQNTTDAVWGLRISTNNGSTFFTSGYNWAYCDGTSVGSGNDPYFKYLASTAGGVAGQGYTFSQQHILQGNATTGVPFQLIGNSMGYTVDSPDVIGLIPQNVGAYNTTTYVNALQIYKQSGSYIVSGTYTLYGVKNA
jgi:hypothetical protein